MEQDEIFELLFDKDEVSWQSILLELVRNEKMDPWDIDVSLLARKYLDMLGKLKELDFRLTGKVVLAAALLLKIKSKRLIGADIEIFDSLFSQSEETEEGFDDFEISDVERMRRMIEDENPKLIPRTPQPRRRKVSIYDLMEALQKAMEVKRRRLIKDIPELKEINLPEKTKDVSEIMRDVFSMIKAFFIKTAGRKKLTFSQLLPAETKEAKVYTFIPLLHLTNQRRIDMLQYEHFGDIEIQLLKAKAQRQKEMLEKSKSKQTL